MFEKPGGDAGFLFGTANIDKMKPPVVGSCLTFWRLRLSSFAGFGVLTVKNSISLLLGAVVVLSVCQSSQAGAKRDPKVDMNECIASARTSNLTFKHDMASFMGVSQERMPALFCQRLADGIRTGRISYSDINNLQLDQPTEIWMVLKGKPKPAAPTHSQAPRSPNFRNCSGIDGAFQVPASQRCPASGYAHY